MYAFDMGEFMSIRSLNIAVALRDCLRIPVRVKARVGRRVRAPSRALEHFYRAPNIVRWGAYYLIERHFKTKIYPPKHVRGDIESLRGLIRFALLVTM
jgi:hypothetical protein